MREDLDKGVGRVRRSDYRKAHPPHLAERLKNLFWRKEAKDELMACLEALDTGELNRRVRTWTEV